MMQQRGGCVAATRGGPCFCSHRSRRRILPSPAVLPTPRSWGVGEKNGTFRPTARAFYMGPPWMGMGVVRPGSAPVMRRTPDDGPPAISFNRTRASRPEYDVVQSQSNGGAYPLFTFPGHSPNPSQHSSTPGGLRSSPPPIEPCPSQTETYPPRLPPALTGLAKLVGTGNKTPNPRYAPRVNLPSLLPCLPPVLMSTPSHACPHLPRHHRLSRRLTHHLHQRRRRQRPTYQVCIFPWQ